MHLRLLQLHCGCWRRHGTLTPFFTQLHINSLILTLLTYSTRECNGGPTFRRRGQSCSKMHHFLKRSVLQVSAKSLNISTSDFLSKGERLFEHKRHGALSHLQWSLDSLRYLFELSLLFRKQRFVSLNHSWCWFEKGNRVSDLPLISVLREKHTSHWQCLINKLCRRISLRYETGSVSHC